MVHWPGLKPKVLFLLPFKKLAEDAPPPASPTLTENICAKNPTQLYFLISNFAISLLGLPSVGLTQQLLQLFNSKLYFLRLMRIFFSQSSIILFICHLKLHKAFMGSV